MGGSFQAVKPLEVSLTDKQIRVMGEQSWVWIRRLVWLPDNTGLILVAKDQRTNPWQIWYLSAITEKALRITNDINNLIGQQTGSH